MDGGEISIIVLRRDSVPNHHQSENCSLHATIYVNDSLACVRDAVVRSVKEGVGDSSAAGSTRTHGFWHE